MKLKRHRVIRGIIRCETGLRIGGTKDAIEIGGMDNPIIRHPITGLPYVPGSSIKGRMRSLIELKNNKFNHHSGEPCNCAQGNCPVCRIFGPHKAPNHSLGPTRLIVRDAMLTEEWEAKLKEAQEEKGIYFAEIKTENWIDRRTGRAADKGLRTQERVPAGTEFKMELVIREFEGDGDRHTVDTVLDGLRLIEKEYIGGSGSRGYGKVTFQQLMLDGASISLHEEAVKVQ